MTQALSFSLNEVDCAAIRDSQSYRLSLEMLALNVGITSLTALSEIEYLIFCSNHIPYWVAKVQEFSLLPGQQESVVARLESMRDVWGGSVAADLKRNHRFDGNPTKNATLPLEFFSAGEPVQFSINLESPKTLSLSKAADILAETYRVDATQVKITISN